MLKQATQEATVAYEYKVETVRSSLVGDKVDAGGLEELLNERAAEGWQVRSVTSTTVKGRVGPGGTDGLIVVLERQRSAA